MVSILLVEDDKRVANALCEALEQMEFNVSHAANGEAALQHEEVDLVLLDLGLPDIDGIELCKKLQERSGVPVIAVTARGSQEARVKGLRAGADDYIVKPFSLSELQARIEAVLRRTGLHQNRSETISIGDLEIDQHIHRVTIAGKQISLSRKEYDLLVVLASEPGRPFSRSDLLLKVWHTVWEGKSRTVDVHVGILRQKLGKSSLIQTVHGVGYAFRGD